MPLFTTNRNSHVKQNVKVPDSHESFFETEDGRKYFRRKLLGDIDTENTLVIKTPEKVLQLSFDKKIHRRAL